MTFTDWLRDTRDRLAAEGATGARRSAYELYVGGLRRASPLRSGGENVFDREWDALLVLDACRVDLMREVAPGYPFLDRPDTLFSVGSSSIEWLRGTFDDEHREELRRTAYVTGNPFSKRVLDGNELLALDEVWRYGWDEDLGTIPARRVTDRAIAAGRVHDPDRLVVHYMQPHLPSVPSPLSEGMNAETLGEGAGWDSPWDMLRRDELGLEEVWAAYRANLEYVLDDVALLLDNLDAERVVLTADHANAIGEWGIYGHPKVPLRALREVPWYETTAEDGGEYESELEPRTETGHVEEKLSDLGYL